MADGATIRIVFGCNFCGREIKNLRSMSKGGGGEYHRQCFLTKDYINGNLSTQRSILDYSKSVGEVSFPLRLRYLSLIDKGLNL